MFKKEKPPAPAAEAEGSTRDDLLFETLRRTKKAKKRKVVITVAIVAAVLVIALLVGVPALQRRVTAQFATGGEDVLSAQAERGSISTVVSGKGTLTNVDTETVAVPDGVEVTDILAAFNDAVEEGELLAVVDMATVRAAMSALQTEIDALDEEIADAQGDTVSSTISAGVPGRVKCLYAQAGSLVEDVMVDNGALAVLSLDGYMAVTLETDALTEGESVQVTLADGTVVAGTVDAVVGKNATVLLTDDGPALDEEVTVQTADGVAVGEGRLTVHNALAVTGYAGAVSRVGVQLDQRVTAYTTLFTLTDTATSASYDALLRSRSEKEETLLALLRIQRHGGITAPISGSVTAVASLDELEEDETLTDIITLSPDRCMAVTISVDEADILSLELGQTADVTVSSVSDETLTGTVTEIDKTDSSGAYTAVITLDKLEGMLPGMTASVEVRIQGVEDAILIPADALNRSSTGYYVYTSYDEASKEYGGRVDVVPGLTGSDYAEIRSGLSEGDTVYYTEAQDGFDFGSMDFGNMPGGGNMPSGGQMPGGGGQMPGGDRPGGFGG